MRAVIFDLDGVITDTSEYHYQAWKKLANKLNISFDRENNEKFRGVGRMECLDMLLSNREYNSEKKRKLAEEKNNYYQKYLEQLSEDNILPGALNLIDKIKKSGYKVAVASASKNTETVIKNLGLENKFDVIADGYSVEETKPEPDIFIYTAKKLGVSPQECLVIEDAKSGIEAALAAGMITVGIGPEKRVGKAHFRYDKVGEINFQQILIEINDNKK